MYLTNDKSKDFSQASEKIAFIKSDKQLFAGVELLDDDLPETMKPKLASDCLVTSNLEEVQKFVTTYAQDKFKNSPLLILADVQPDNPNMPPQRTLVFCTKNTDGTLALAHITDGSKVDNAVIEALGKCDGVKVLNANQLRAQKQGRSIGAFMGGGFAVERATLASMSLREAMVDKMAPMALQQGLVSKPTPQAAQ